MKDGHTVRTEARKAFEEELKKLKERAKLAGFRIEGGLYDPVEEAVGNMPVLIDAKSILRDTFHTNVILAHTLGYNVRVDRQVNPLDARCPLIFIDVWQRRNEDGGYDE
jgi:hypothetical protein